MEHREQLENITQPGLAQTLDFVLEADGLKHILRQTLLVDGSRRENDAEHSWHLALMAPLMLRYSAIPHVDLTRVLEMLTVHDLVEIYAGDTFAYDEKGKESKAAREAAAADRLFALLPGEDGEKIRALWEEFDAEETDDARYAAALDHFQPFLHNICTEGHTWRMGMPVTEKQIRDRMAVSLEVFPGLRDWFEAQVAAAISKGWIVPSE